MGSSGAIRDHVFIVAGRAIGTEAAVVEFAGDFETHLTVRCGGHEVDALARWAGERGLKFTHIELARGQVVVQRCRLVGARAAGRRLEVLTSALHAKGYEIAAVEREYVVFDGDESLDEGWIDEEGRSA